VTQTKPIREQFVIPRLAVDIFYPYTKSRNSNLIVPEVRVQLTKLKIGITWLDHAPYSGALSSAGNDLIGPICIQNSMTLIFSWSRDINGAHKNLHGSRDVITPFFRDGLSPWATTCDSQPAYPIWSIYLHPLQDMKGNTKCGKWGGMG